jgi:hypothetical protein
MNIPEKGFYYHYKHTGDSVNNYAYEVIGVGRNTEENTFTVLYRPLYESDWMPPADFQSRPLDMFMGQVEKEGKTFPRFSKITDQKIVAELLEIKRSMYKD